MSVINELVDGIRAIGEDNITELQTRKIRAAIKMTNEVESKVIDMLRDAGIYDKNPAYGLVFDMLSDNDSYIRDFLELKKVDLMDYLKDSLQNPKDIYKDLSCAFNGNIDLTESLFGISYLEGMITRGKGEVALALLSQDAKMIPLIGSNGDIVVNNNVIEIKHSSSPQSSYGGRLHNDSGGTGNNGMLKKVDDVLVGLRNLIASLPQNIFKITPDLPDTGMKVCYTKGKSKRVDKWLMEHLKPEYANENTRDIFVDFFVSMWQNFFINEVPIVREIIEMLTYGISFQDMIDNDMSVIPTSRSEEFGKYMMAIYLTNYLKTGSLLSITKQNDGSSRSIYVDSSLIEGKSVYEVYNVLKDTKLTFAWPSIRKSAGKCVFGGVYVSK